MDEVDHRGLGAAGLATVAREVVAGYFEALAALAGRTSPPVQGRPQKRPNFLPARSPLVATFAAAADSASAAIFLFVVATRHVASEGAEADGHCHSQPVLEGWTLQSLMSVDAVLPIELEQVDECCPCRRLIQMIGVGHHNIRVARCRSQPEPRAAVKGNYRS